MNTNPVTKSDKKVVTVAVITYHSATTVLETLDSIVNQSYGPENIELIISDDGSRDNTVQMIEDWLALYQSLFYNVLFIANKENGGVSKNCNVAWKTATSEWIKTIAGDDILLSNCLTDNIEYAIKNPHCSAIFSIMQSFESEGGFIKTGILQPENHRFSFFEKSAEQQLNSLLIDSFNFAPTSFLKKSLLCKVGYADDSYKLIEDLPLWIKITSIGERLHFFKNVTVLYRFSESISRSSDRLVNPSFLHDLLRLHRELIYPRLQTPSDYLMYFDRIFLFKSSLLIAKITGNRKCRLSIYLKFCVSLVRPRAYINKFREMQRSFFSGNNKC